MERRAIRRTDSRFLAQQDALARELRTHCGSLPAVVNEPEREDLFEDLIEPVCGLKG